MGTAAAALTIVALLLNHRAALSRVARAAEPSRISRLAAECDLEVNRVAAADLQTDFL